MNCSGQRGLSPRRVLKFGWLPKIGPNRLPTMAIFSSGSQTITADQRLAAGRGDDLEPAAAEFEGVVLVDQQVGATSLVGTMSSTRPVMPPKIRREPRR